MKTISIAVLAVLGAAAEAVSHAPAPTSEDSTAQVEIKVLAKGSDAVLFEAKSPVELHSTSEFQERAARGPQKLEVKVHGEPRDGALVFDVAYGEITREGQELQWRPVVRLARGQSIESDVDWEGGGRRLLLTVK